MPKHKTEPKKSIPWKAVWGVLGSGIVLTLIQVFVSPVVSELIKRTPVPSPSPTPACISADDILVTFDISRNQTMITTLVPSDTAYLDPGLTVYFHAKIAPVVVGTVLPKLTYTWTNTGIAANQGTLLHKIGDQVDYHIGSVGDAVSMQVSQGYCPALAPYPFFIMPKLTPTP